MQSNYKNLNKSINDDRMIIVMKKFECKIAQLKIHHYTQNVKNYCHADAKKKYLLAERFSKTKFYNFYVE